MNDYAAAEKGYKTIEGVTDTVEKQSDDNEEIKDAVAAECGIVENEIEGGAVVIVEENYERAFAEKI
ncbi:MAG: hypothetical protein QG635_2077 [Bacteroidota bacterium]|nr:hypothetical protein [Bacteroidota bacterium]